MKIFEQIPTQSPQIKLLEKINQPQDIHKLTPKQLEKLADELREFLIYQVAENGGHFSSGLGVIELTIALLKVYDVPQDKIIWDVGHQAYPYKILTERRNQIHTIRKIDGLAPFLSREESQYDVFGAGHSSTSISAGLGMSVARSLLKQKNEIISIIGDGSLTAGLAFEGLNNAGYLDNNLTVIFNDNNMSISKNVGAISKWVNKILKSEFYLHFKKGSKKILNNMPTMLDFAIKSEKNVKNFFAPASAFFESLGCEYFGPIDGHNIKELINTFNIVKGEDGVKVIHIITQKGKGFTQAQDDPIKYHALKQKAVSRSLNIIDETYTKFEKINAVNQSITKINKLTYSQNFDQWLCDTAKKNQFLVAITPAMCEGSGMIEFAKKYPKQFFDVGIAEQHCITFAAGLACDSKIRPIVAIYSTFLQRGYDQLIHDVCIQNLPVVFAVDRAGIVGEDGTTHSGTFDISFCRPIPNLAIMCPCDKNEQYAMLNLALTLNQPSIVRYPRGNARGVKVDKKHKITLGQAQCLIENKTSNIFLLNFGNMIEVAEQLCEHFQANLIDMRFVKPLDEKLLNKIATHKNCKIISLEEHTLAGGAGSAVVEFYQQSNIKKQPAILNIGLDNGFVIHGNPVKIRERYGLDFQSCKNKIEKFLA